MNRRSFLKLLATAQAALFCRAAKPLAIKKVKSFENLPACFADGVYIYKDIQPAQADFRQFFIEVWKDGEQLLNFSQRFTRLFLKHDRGYKSEEMIEKHIERCIKDTYFDKHEVRPDGGHCFETYSLARLDLPINFIENDDHLSNYES